MSLALRDEWQLVYHWLDEVEDYLRVKPKNYDGGDEDEDWDKQSLRLFNRGFVLWFSRVHVVYQPHQVGGLKNAR